MNVESAPVEGDSNIGSRYYEDDNDRIIFDLDEYLKNRRLSANTRFGFDEEDS